MATRYVTLKDSNGDTLYPQAVATNLAPGGIGTAELANGAVTSAKIADGTIATADIANGAVTPAKLSRGYKSLVYYDTNIVTITDGTYSALASGTITTYGGDIYVSGFVYGVKTSGGTNYLHARIDGTDYKLSQNNLQGNAPLYASQIISGISAGTHTISFAVTIQSGTNRSYAVNSYCQDYMTFIEL